MIVPLLFLALSPDPHSIELPFNCPDAAQEAAAYLLSHGIYISPDNSHLPNLTIAGDNAFVSGRRVKLRPWTDADGRKIDDDIVLRDFADKTSTKTRAGLWWLLRLAHYRPSGEMKFSPIGTGCAVEFQLLFGTDGAAVLGILPVSDEQWAYRSNGRLEREYLDAISAQLTKQDGHAPGN
jgi:hypothetical protein